MLPVLVRFGETVVFGLVAEVVMVVVAALEAVLVLVTPVDIIPPAALLARRRARFFHDLIKIKVD